MNCDFSSNDNIWARFYEFLWRPFWIVLGVCYCDKLIGISRMNFLAAILNWNFRLQTANFRSPHWAFVLNRSIFVCQMESHSEFVEHILTCLSVDLMLYHFSRPFWFLFGYFYYDRLIGISRMSFLAAILIWNFRLQTSDLKFQKSPLSFCT